MNLEAIGIPLAFAILVAVILWFIIAGKGHWLLKMLFVSVALYFSIAMWHSLGDLVGWPSNNPLPDKFLVHWLVVKEGIPGGKDPGAIFLWATELDKNDRPKVDKQNPYLISFIAKKTAVEPRSYRMPYTREMHQQANGVLKLLKAGKQVVGEGEGEGSGMGEGDGKGGKGKGGKSGKGKGKKGMFDGLFGGSFSHSPFPIFHELPPPKLPAKVTGEDN